MDQWIVPPMAGLIETSMLPDLFFDGIGAVERNHSLIRLYFYQNQMSLSASVAQKVVVAKMATASPSVCRILAGIMPERSVRPRCRCGQHGDVIPFKS